VVVVVVTVEVAVVVEVVTVNPVEAAEVAEVVASWSLMTTLSPLSEQAAPTSVGSTKVNVKRLSHFQHVV